MCYYHSCVQYLKLIVLYWNFLLLCVWTDICTLYLFYVSEINIYYYYYYYNRVRWWRHIADNRGQKVTLLSARTARGHGTGFCFGHT